MSNNYSDLDFDLTDEDAPVISVESDGSSMYDNFFEQIDREIDADNTDGMDNASWLCRHTKHPKNSDQPWSFHLHEFQIDIVNSRAPQLSCEKCSQIGLSELQVRWALMAVVRGRAVTGIYVFPTAGDVAKFSAHRVATVVDDSPVFKTQVNPDLNNNAQKQFGHSFLYFAGSQKVGISIPADFILSDETNFSNQTNLTTYASRMGHVDPENPGPFHKFAKFSTPTIPEFGVSDAYNKSSKGRYGVKCDRCSTWSVLDFFDDVYIPGFDNDLREFRKEDLYDPRYKIKEAHLLCPCCHKPLRPENMIESSKRQWIHENPSLLGIHDGFHVEPYDVYKINPPSRTLSQLEDYKQYADWVNFKVGQPYADASSTLVEPKLVKDPGRVKGTRFMGIDVGKTSWIVIIEMETSGVIRIIHLEKVQLRWVTGSTSTFRRVHELRNQFNVSKFVVDSMPDISLSASLVATSLRGLMSEYTEKPPNHEIIEEKGEVIKIYRTGIFNETAKRLSRADIEIINGLSEIEIFKNHLKGIKKITDDEGKERWVKLKDDHYAHSLIYAIAATGQPEAVRTNRLLDVATPYTIPTFGVGSGLSNKTKGGIIY